MMEWTKTIHVERDIFKGTEVADINEILADIKERFRLSDDEITHLSDTLDSWANDMIDEKKTQQIYLFKAPHSGRYFGIEIEIKVKMKQTIIGLIDFHYYWVNWFEEFSKDQWEYFMGALKEAASTEEGITFHDTEEVQG